MKLKIKILLTIAVILAVFLILIFKYFETQNEEIEKVVFYDNGEKIVEVSVEIADDNEKISRGLMYRGELPENKGMLFVFPNEDYHSFWMKNTLIPLDMIFLNADRNIVSITKNVPPCRQNPCSTYSSKEKSQYVIEVNAGFCDRYEISENTKVEF